MSATKTWPPAPRVPREIGSGIAVARDAVRGELALLVAGLLTNEPLEDVVARLEELQEMLTEQGVRDAARP